MLPELWSALNRVYYTVGFVGRCSIQNVRLTGNIAMIYSRLENAIARESRLMMRLSSGFVHLASAHTVFKERCVDGRTVGLNLWFMTQFKVQFRTPRQGPERVQRCEWSNKSRDHDGPSQKRMRQINPGRMACHSIADHWSRNQKTKKNKKRPLS